MAPEPAWEGGQKLQWTPLPAELSSLRVSWFLRRSACSLPPRASHCLLGPWATVSRGLGPALWGRWGRLQVFGLDLGSLGGERKG